MGDLLETISATQIREKQFAECNAEKKDPLETISETQIREKQLAECNTEEKELLETISALLMHLCGASLKYAQCSLALIAIPLQMQLQAPLLKEIVPPSQRRAVVDLIHADTKGNS